MSIILKKKKGLLIPKSHPPTPSQILGNIGINSILGSSHSKKEEMINDIIEEAIQRLISEKLLLYSTRVIRSLEYFVSYRLNEGEKEIKTLFLKKKSWLSFVSISQDEMLATGARPEEFVSYLKKKRCKKIKISREQLENNI